MGSFLRALVILVVAAVFAAGSITTCAEGPAGGPGPAAAGDQAAESASLKDEVERLKGMVPDQSHVMKDVG